MRLHALVKSEDGPPDSVLAKPSHVFTSALRKIAQSIRASFIARVAKHSSSQSEAPADAVPTFPKTMLPLMKTRRNCYNIHPFSDLKCPDVKIFAAIGACLLGSEALMCMTPVQGFCDPSSVSSLSAVTSKLLFPEARLVKGFFSHTTSTSLMITSYLLPSSCCSTATLQEILVISTSQDCQCQTFGVTSRLLSRQHKITSSLRGVHLMQNAPGFHGSRSQTVQEISGLLLLHQPRLL